MSILILRGPHAASAIPSFAATMLDRQLRQRAQAAGESLRCRVFASLGQLLGGLHRVDRHDGMVLIDAGDFVVDGIDEAHALRDALDALPAPYIEVHDDAAHALEPRVQPRHAPLVTLILRDDLPRAYAMALDIALHRMGRATPAGALHA